jgi:hypothetical protein
VKERGDSGQAASNIVAHRLIDDKKKLVQGQGCAHADGTLIAPEYIKQVYSKGVRR